VLRGLAVGPATACAARLAFRSLALPTRLTLEYQTGSYMSPIHRLFVTHAWLENDDYTRVFEYLEPPVLFYYHNTSQPQAKQPIDKESQREDLRRQIAPCEVVVVLPAVYRLPRSWCYSR